MSYIFPKGSTSKSIDVFIQDSSSTTGEGLAALAFDTGSLTAYYHRQGGTATSITLATLAAVDSAFSSGGFKEIASTNMKGTYRLDVPDACLATGADYVTIHLRGAANMVPCPVKIQLAPVPADIKAIDGGTAAALADCYQAAIYLTRDVTNTQDEWLVSWYKNGVPVSTAITSPTLQVVKRADGTDLVAAAALTQVGSTKQYKLTTLTTQRVTVGEQYTAYAAATIDGGARTFEWPVGRDATS